MLRLTQRRRHLALAVFSGRKLCWQSSWALTVIDANTNDEFTYAISGEGAENFEVIDGQLMVKSGTWLDYETKSTYTLTINVTDQGGYNIEKTVTINVNDVDYGNPWFSEHVSVWDVPISSDIGIRGQQWTYKWAKDRPLLA